MIEFESTTDAKNFAAEFLKRYTAIGFGALSKREVDLLVIELIQTHISEFKEMSAFDVAINIRTTIRKVHGLREELLYRKAIDRDLDDELRGELRKAEMLPGNEGMVKIQIDDTVLRGYAEKLIREDFRVVDTSFNKAILQISGENFLLLGWRLLDENEMEEALKVVNKISKGKSRMRHAAKSNFRLFKEAFIAGAGNKAGNLCVSAAMALVSGGSNIFLETAELEPIVSGGITAALKRARSLFKDDTN